MLKYRLPSGLALGAAVLGSVFWKGNPGWLLFLCFGAFLAFAAVYEYLKMLEKIELKSYPLLSSLLAVAILCALLCRLPVIMLAAAFCVIIICAWLSILFTENKKNALLKASTSFSALPMLVFPLVFLALIYLKNGSTSGRIYFLFLLVVTKTGDIGAYSFGTASAKLLPGGNHKIIPSISPKKSWEGTLGGLFSSIAISYAFCMMTPELCENRNSLFPLLAGALLFIGGFTGDLVESALKRTAGVKDSGNMIPGMGGALDVIDSLILNAPLFYFLCL